MGRLRWIDFLRSNGINPEDEIPGNTDIIEKEQEVTESKEIEETGNESIQSTGEGTESINKLVSTIDSLQKQVIQLKEANKDMALKGTVDMHRVPIEEEIKNIMEGM